MNNRIVLIAAGTLIVLGIFAFLFNTFMSSPLEPVETAPTTEVVPQEATFEDGAVDEAALIGGEAEGKPITNVAEAVQAIDTMNFDALDAQLAADLADIEASFE
jgi:hypothetical protein